MKHSGFQILVVELPIFNLIKKSSTSIISVPNKLILDKSWNCHSCKY